MQSEEREKIRKQAVTLIRSLLISTKGGVPIEKMSRKLFIILFVSSKNERIQEFRVLKKRQGSLFKPLFNGVLYFIITLKNISNLAFSF